MSMISQPCIATFNPDTGVSLGESVIAKIKFRGVYFGKLTVFPTATSHSI